MAEKCCLYCTGYHRANAHEGTCMDKDSPEFGRTVSPVSLCRTFSGDQGYHRAMMREDEDYRREALGCERCHQQREDCRA